MKLSIFLSIASFICSLASCNFIKTDKTSQATVEFTVSDNKPEETYSDINTIHEFRSLTMKGVGNVFYEQADSTSLKIKGPLNLLDKIIVENRGEELYISFDPDYKELNDVKNIYYYITSPELVEVKIKGVTTFYSPKKWVAEVLELSVEGVGEIKADNISSKTLDVEMDGVGKIKLNVKCNEINTDIKGIGKFEISGETDILNTNNKGIGKMDLSNLKIGKRSDQ